MVYGSKNFELLSFGCLILIKIQNDFDPEYVMNMDLKMKVCTYEENNNITLAKRIKILLDAELLSVCQHHIDNN